MPSSIRQALVAAAIATAAVGSILLVLTAMSCDASQHVRPAPQLIVVPGPDQVTGTIDASRMDWLSRFIDSESGTAGR